jgi:alkylation response protein AidB-like acyl-CoA dehydrogenase
MDLAITDEQRQMAAAVRAFLAAHVSPELVRHTMSDGEGVHRELWRKAAAELGLAGLLVPEADGGTGLGLPELAVVAEELGRVPFGLPMLSNVLAVHALADSPELLAAVATGDTLAAVVLDADVTVRAHADGWLLDGTAEHIPDGHVGDMLIVAAGSALYAVDSASCAREHTIDQTRPLARIEFAATPARRLPGTPDMLRLRDIGALTVAAEAVGGASHCLELAVGHAMTRTQFGRPIGAQQAIKHLCADLLRALEPARAAVRLAAHSVDTDEFGVLVSVAKIAATETYFRIACETIQLHGALGHTWEHDAHLHYKRAMTDQLLFGDADVRELRITAAPTEDRSPTDHPELRAEVRTWLAAHEPAAVPAGGAHPPHDHHVTERERHWLDLLRAGRWLCLSWPVEYGGRGLSEMECIAVNEEFARAEVSRPRLGMGESLVAPALLTHGTPEQKQRFLPGILAGDDVYCQGFSEPEAGSDLAGLCTTGTVDGTELVIDGHKIWSSGADQANMMFLLCRTDPDAGRHHGLSYVLVPMPDNGIEVRPIRQQTGGDGFCEEFIDGARTPLANVIGGLGNGWRVAMTTLGAERTGEITTQYLGYGRELDRLVHRLAERGRLADPGVRHEVARLAIGVHLLRASGRRVADELRAGQPVDAQLAIDKINWSEFHCDFGAAALRLQGLAGLVRPTGDDYQVDEFQRIFLESRGRRIARGTNQIQRNIIAERILHLPR